VVGDLAGLVTLTAFRAAFLEQPNDCASHRRPAQTEACRLSRPAAQYVGSPLLVSRTGNSFKDRAEMRVLFHLHVHWATCRGLCSALMGQDQSWSGNKSG